MKKILGIILFFISFASFAQSKSLGYPNYLYLIFGAPQGEQTSLIEQGSQTRTIVAHDFAKTSCSRLRPNDPPYKISLTVADPASNSSFVFAFENQNQQPLAVGSKIGLQSTVTMWTILGGVWRATALHMDVREIGPNYIIASAQADIGPNGMRNFAGYVFANSEPAVGHANIVKSEIKITCN